MEEDQSIAITKDQSLAITNSRSRIYVSQKGISLSGYCVQSVL